MTDMNSDDHIRLPAKAQNRLVAGRPVLGRRPEMLAHFLSLPLDRATRAKSPAVHKDQFGTADPLSDFSALQIRHFLASGFAQGQAPATEEPDPLVQETGSAHH